jgi:hypothetical protein
VQPRAIAIPERPSAPPEPDPIPVLTDIRIPPPGTAILEEAGTSLDRVVSATVVLADEDDFAGMNEEWLRWFPSDPPARQGAKLPVRIPGLKVSIAAIAEA